MHSHLSSYYYFSFDFTRFYGKVCSRFAAHRDAFTCA